MTTYVKKWGNSLAVRIPKHLSDSMRLKEGSPLVFEKTGGQLLIKSVRDRRLEVDDIALFNLTSGGFDFLSDEPDLYTADDCKIRFR